MFKSGNYSAALPTIREYAERGNPAAQFELARAYARGFGQEVDSARAEMWLRRMECGCRSPGQGELGLALDMLTEPGLDKTQAARWLIRAAEAGSEEAQRLVSNAAEMEQRGLKIDGEAREYWAKRRPER